MQCRRRAPCALVPKVVEIADWHVAGEVGKTSNVERKVIALVVELGQEFAVVEDDVEVEEVYTGWAFAFQVGAAFRWIDTCREALEV